jgi:hypothetical protein
MSNSAAETYLKVPALLTALLAITTLIAVAVSAATGGVDRALAEGEGYVGGDASVRIGDQRLNCTYTGVLDGGSTDTTAEGGADASEVESTMSGNGTCVAPSATSSRGESRLPFRISITRQEVLEQTITAQLQGLIVEQSSDEDGILEFPADGTFEVLLEIETTSIGVVHNRPSEPMLLDCPEITDYTEFSCALQERTEVVLYDESDETAMATIDDANLNFNLNVQPEAPPTVTQTPDPNLNPDPPDPDDDPPFWLGLLLGALGGAAVVGAAWFVTTRASQGGG